MRTREDLVGMRFGRLNVIGDAGKKGTHHSRLCLCSCGNNKIISGCNLKNGKTNSCGCLNIELIKTRSTTHGMRHTRFYQIYYRAKNRCENKGNNRYYLYGGRGIRFLWDSFESFRDDMYESYLQHIKDFGEKDTTIERKDNDKDYCKENCKRATNEEQANNQRRIKKIEINGESKSLKQWCRFYNLSYGMVFARISRGANIMSSLNIETIEAAE